ncbi:MAG TPA: aldo/keto reductase [Bacillota bacterium]|nr:aldo/keto reductase [Bacillota bacterium]
MKNRKLDKLDIEASLLGFGCMRFPTLEDDSIDVEQAEEMLDVAYKNGVNYFDTAYGYHGGKSEEFVGKALDRYDRSSYYLATKLPCWLVKETEDVQRLFEEQLTRLNKDYVDFYLLHALNKKQFDRMVDLGVLEICDKLKKEGKIKYFGFSFHDDYDAFKYILEYRDWDFCQIQLNYMDTDIQAGMEGYELTEKLDIPLVIMEPIKGGNLANYPENISKHFEAVTPGMSTASWAMRWIASLPNVKVVLSGMSTMEQVVDNIATYKNFKPLNSSEYEAVARVVDELARRAKNGCTSCEYCMPCPSGVDIPGNFNVWNNYGIYDNKGESKWRWKENIKDEAKAKQCVECGQCEELCPQNLSIIEDLKKVQEELDAL